MIKKILFTFLVCITGFMYCQEFNLNKDQYIIVPNQFDFVNTIDGYQTSSLTKFLLQKNGFPVFLSNETIPKALSENKCAALIVAIKDDSSMLQTKSYFEAKDCFGKVIYTSGLGKSKFKDYKKAYHESIRKAHKTMSDFKYSYVDVDLINSKEKDVVAANVSDEAYEITMKNEKLAKELKKQKVDNNVKSELPSDFLYAQPIPNGFQLVNSKPEIVYTLLKTGKSNVYILKNEKGIIYEKGNKWIVEYYKASTLIQEELHIKF